MTRLAQLLVASALVASVPACSCAPAPVDAGFDARMMDAGPVPDCMVESHSVRVGPLRPGALENPVLGIDGLGVAGPISRAVVVRGALVVSAGLIRPRDRVEAALAYTPDGSEHLVWSTSNLLPRQAYDPVTTVGAALSFQGTIGVVVPDWCFGGCSCEATVCDCAYTGCRPWSMVVDDTTTSERLFEVRLAERFPGGVSGACDVPSRGYAFFNRPDRVTLLWPSTCPRAIDEASTTVRYRLNSWQRDGTEVTPPDGVPVEEPVFLVSYLPEVDSLDTNDAGELFYGSNRTALDGTGPVAIRIVRRAPDMTLSMVSEPITDPIADPPARDGSRNPYGFWGAATEDGAYVAHLRAPIEPGGAPYSHFVRVESDGSIGWHYTTLASAARDWQGLDRMVAESDGGIVALVSDRSLPADLSFFAVERDGTLVHGPMGLPIAASVGFTEAVRDAWVAIDSDGEGGVFIALLGEHGPSTASHLAANGAVLFEPVVLGPFSGDAEAVESYHVLADGIGGMWAVKLASPGFIQHLDALGRPTYAHHNWYCRADNSLRTSYEIIDYDDPDAGPSLDASDLDASDLDADTASDLDATDLDATDAPPTDADASSDPDAGPDTP